MKSNHYQDEGDVVMIYKGLSVRLCGCLIEVERDDDAQEARVLVDTGGRTSLDPLDFEAVKSQANLLRERAQRFFGARWKVYAWDGKVAVVAAPSQDQPNKAG